MQCAPLFTRLASRRCLNARARRLALFGMALMALGAGLPTRAAAQAGSTTDIIVGRVVGSDSLPIVRARVTAVSTQTGLTRQTMTGRDGRYTIVFPDGGGAYQLSVIRIGFVPSRTDIRLRPGTDRLVADAVLRRAALTLTTVVVRASRDSSDTRGGSGTGRTIAPGQLNRLPVNPGDLASLAGLAPGVVITAATDSTTTSFSVAGQPASQNTITLDGLTQGTGQVPRDAIQSTRIITNTYDVAKGQFLGGQIASTTRRGTNQLTASMTATMRNPSLTFAEPISPAFSGAEHNGQFSAGLGGPIIRNRLYAFGAFQFDRRSAPVASVLAADPVTLSRLGLSPDTLARFLSGVSSAGLPISPPGFPGNRVRSDGSALVRFDLQLNDANDLVFRGDWHDRQQTGARVEWHGLAQSEGEGSGRGTGAMLALTSQFGSFVNDARVYRAGDSFDQSGYWTLPRGRVNTTSVLPNGVVGVTSLQFGGNSSLPRWNHSTMFEASDEISWLSPDATHRVKLGVLLDHQSQSTNASGNKYGAFTYASIANLLANQPSSYSRTLATQPQGTASTSGAVYLGDAWRPTDALAVTYGFRAEWASYGRRPGYNPLVDSLFQRRTNQFPTDFLVSPRVGFAYSAGGDADRPALQIRGGVGEFRGNARSWLFSLASGQTGLVGAEQQLTCIGGAVPVPDWSQYLSDPSTIPSTCNGAASNTSSALPRVTVFSPSYGAPRVWRASLGATKPFGDHYSLAVDALYAYGLHEQGVTDLNLNTTPQFRLAAEANRPVYVPAGSIDPSTGTTSLNASRLVPSLSNVLQINSALHSDTRQLIVTFEREVNTGLSFSTSYTYTQSRDQSQGFEGAEYDESTSGNPNRAEWSWNDDARQHQFLALLSYQFNPAVELTFVGHAMSGRRFTPRVRGDINGDGIQNDRAFVFDPAKTSDSTLAAGMRELLANADARTRHCLQSQMGTIAGRNSCSSPWRTTFDLQLNLTPNVLGLHRRLTLSVTAVNTMAGLDAALHGMDHLRGWGQYARTDDHLLFVNGFDASTQQFRYQVNQHFGSSSLSQSPFRSPFLLQLQARFAVGELN